MLLCVIKRFVSGTLQLHCKFHYCHKMSSVVCLSSVTRVYCDKMAEARIMQLSLPCSLSSKPAKFDYEIRRGHHDCGLKLGWGGFRFRDAISWRWSEIELR